MSNGVNNKGKYFVACKQKNLIFQGEFGAILDGATSTNMSGFAMVDGNLEIKNLIISGFKKDSNCNSTVTACSIGVGIDAYFPGHPSTVLITNNTIVTINARYLIVGKSEMCVVITCCW
jgi:hypothetical protein